MADVNDRAQMFLVGALVLAILLIALALLLNTAIYTGNIASRNPGPGTTEVVEYERATEAMAGEFVVAVNYANNTSHADATPYAELRSAFESSVDRWSETAAIHHHAAATDAHVGVAATVRGTRIGQDTARNFTNDSANANWTVINDSHTRSFTMNVSQSSLADVDPGTTDLLTSTAFHVVVTGADDTEYELYVYDPPSGTNDVAVAVFDDGDTEVGTCTDDAGGDGFLVVDVTGERVGDTDCPALGYAFENVTTYDVEYQQATMPVAGDRVSGTYSLVVERDIDRVYELGYDDTGRDPYITSALYSVHVDVVYRSPVAFYETQVRVAPGEADE